MKIFMSGKINLSSSRYTVVGCAFGENGQFAVNFPVIEIDHEDFQVSSNFDGKFVGIEINEDDTNGKLKDLVNQPLSSVSICLLDDDVEEMQDKVALKIDSLSIVDQGNELICDPYIFKDAKCVLE